MHGVVLAAGEGQRLAQSERVALGDRDQQSTGPLHLRASQYYILLRRPATAAIFLEQ